MVLEYSWINLTKFSDNYSLITFSLEVDIRYSVKNKFPITEQIITINIIDTNITNVRSLYLWIYHFLFIFKQQMRVIFSDFLTLLFN